MKLMPGHFILRISLRGRLDPFHVRAGVLKMRLDPGESFFDFVGEFDRYKCAHFFKLFLTKSNTACEAWSLISSREPLKRNSFTTFFLSAAIAT